MWGWPNGWMRVDACPAMLPVAASSGGADAAVRREGGHVRRRAASGSELRFVRLQMRLRLFITAAALLGMWVGGIDDPHRPLATGLVLLGYWPAVLVLERSRVGRDRRWLQDLTVALDLSGGLTVGLLVPDLRPTLAVLLLVLVATESVAAGRRRGIAVAATAVVVYGVVEASASSSPMTSSLALALAGAAIAVPLVIAYLTDEHRKVAAHLGRLSDALMDLDATPELETTLASLGETARSAVSGRFGRIVLGAPSDVATGGPRATPLDLTRDARHLDDGAARRAIATGEVVVVADPGTDALTAASAGRLEDQGVRSIIALPLRVGDEVLGALSIGLPHPGGPDADDLALLRTYSQAAALQILRSQAFEQTRLAAERLERSTEERIAFIAAVTHDLRTPLTTIKGFVDTVLAHHDRLDRSEVTRMLQVASRNADSLSRRIGTLLQFTKMEADRLEVTPAPIDLRAAIESVLEDCAGLLEDHPVELDLADAEVLADTTALAHVLGNLLSNAAKYSAPLDPIRITTEVGEDEVRIVVVDQGPGIPPDDRERIFETFVRGSQPSAGGTGLGLAIAKRYIQLSGGRIGVERPREGSAFWFTLPRTAVTIDLTERETDGDDVVV